MIGQELKKVRENQGLTQRALAEATGVPQSRIGAVERGESEFTEEQTELINQYFAQFEPTEIAEIEGEILHEDEYTTLVAVDEKHEQYGVNHVYTVHDNSNGEAIEALNYQKGPRKVEGLNGITDEDIARILHHRLTNFAEGEYADRYTEHAAAHAFSVLRWLTDRKREREMRGVEGTNEQ